MKFIAILTFIVWVFSAQFLFAQSKSAPQVTKPTQKVLSKANLQNNKPISTQTPCPSGEGMQKMATIQVCLKQKGYYKGVIDNLLGPSTRQALVKYQKDNKLPVGNLNLETIKHLGKGCTCTLP